MEWEEEREKLEQIIESNIEWAEEEIRFWEMLLDLLQEAATKEPFLKESMRKAEEYPNPWIRDKLCAFVDNLVDNSLYVN
jgi:hypothetical protein